MKTRRNWKATEKIYTVKEKLEKNSAIENIFLEAIIVWRAQVYEFLI